MKISTHCILLLSVTVGCSPKEHSLQSSSDPTKFIGKTYTDICLLDTDIKPGTFISIGEHGKYGLVEATYKKWIRKDGTWSGSFVIFEKDVGKEGQYAVQKILDIVVVNSSKLKSGAEIGLDECKMADSLGVKNSVSTVSVYVKNDDYSPVHPEKVWIADLIKEKLIPTAPEKLLCAPIENEGEGEGD